MATNVSLLQFVRGTAYSESGWQSIVIVASNRLNNEVRSVAGGEAWQISWIPLVVQQTNRIEVMLVVQGVVRAGQTVEVIAETGRPELGITLPVWAGAARTNTVAVRWAGVARDRMSGIRGVEWTNTHAGAGGAAVLHTNDTWHADVALANGSNGVVFVCRDNAGNASSIVVHVVVDARAPHFRITTPGSASVNTPFNAMRIEGVAWDEDAPPVSVGWTNMSHGGAGVAEVSATGTWHSIVALLMGTNQVRFSACDNMGNCSNLVVDIVRSGVTGHAVVITVPTSGPEWISGVSVIPVVGGTAVSETPWELLTIVISNAQNGWSTVAAASSAWSKTWIQLTGQSATNEVVVSMRNASGEVARAALRVLADYEGPPAPLPLQPAQGAVVSNAWPVLAWSSVEDVSGIALYEVVLDGAVTMRVAGTWLQVTQAVVYGSHTWRVRAVNGAGKSGAWSVERSFTITDVPGVIQLTQPPDGTCTNATRVRFGWEAEHVLAPQELYINNVFIAGGQGEAVVDVSEGTNRWYVRGQQVSGVMVYSLTNRVIVDTTPPSVLVLAPQDYAVVSNMRVTVRVLAWDTLSGVAQVAWTNTTFGGGGTMVRLGGGEWQAEALLGVGTNVVTIVAWNGAGLTAEQAVRVVAERAEVIVVASAALYGFPDGSRGQLCFNRSLPVPVGCLVELVHVGSLPPAAPYSVEDALTNVVLVRSTIGSGRELLGGYMPTNGEFALVHTARCERLEQLVVRTYSGITPEGSVYYDYSPVFNAAGYTHYPVPIMRNVKVHPGYVIPALGVPAAITVMIEATSVDISGTAPSGWGDNQLPSHMLEVEWLMEDGGVSGREAVYMGWWDARIPLNAARGEVCPLLVRARSSSEASGLPTGVWQTVLIYRVATPVTNALAIRITQPTDAGRQATNVAELTLAGTYEVENDTVAAITWAHVESRREGYAQWGSQEWIAASVPCDYATNTLRVCLQGMSGMVATDTLVVVRIAEPGRDMWIKITEPTSSGSWETNAATMLIAGEYRCASVVEQIRWERAEDGAQGRGTWDAAAWSAMVPCERATNTLRVRLHDMAGVVASDTVVVVRIAEPGTDVWIRITEPTSSGRWETNAVTMLIAGEYRCASVVEQIRWKRAEDGAQGTGRWDAAAWSAMVPSERATNTLRVMLVCATGGAATGELVVVRSSSNSAQNVEVLCAWPRYLGVGQTGYCEFVTVAPAAPCAIVWGANPAEGVLAGTGVSGSTYEDGYYACLPFVINDAALIENGYGSSNALWVVVQDGAREYHGKAPRPVWVVPDLPAGSSAEVGTDIDGDRVLVQLESRHGTVRTHGRTVYLRGTGLGDTVRVVVQRNALTGDGHVDLAMLDIQDGKMKTFIWPGDVDEIRLRNAEVRHIQVRGGNLGFEHGRRSRTLHGVVADERGAGIRTLAVRARRYDRNGVSVTRGGDILGDHRIARTWKGRGVVVMAPDGMLHNCTLVAGAIDRLVASMRPDGRGSIVGSCIYASGVRSGQRTSIRLVKAGSIVDSRIGGAGDIVNVKAVSVRDSLAYSATNHVGRAMIVAAGVSTNEYDMWSGLFVLPTWKGFIPKGVVRNWLVRDVSEAVIVTAMPRSPAGAVQRIKIAPSADRAREQWYVDGIAAPKLWDGKSAPTVGSPQNAQPDIGVLRRREQYE